MPEATPRLRQVVFVVDASSALSGIFGHLLTDYIVPCLEYLHGAPIVEKHKPEQPQVQYGTVSVNPSPSISAPPCSYYQVTEDPSVVLTQLRAIRFERGLIEQACKISEGMAAALEMLDMMDRFRVGSNNFNPQALIEKHCIIVINQPPAPQPVIASRKYGGQNHLQLAEHYSNAGIHLSVISPRWLAQYKELFLKATPTPDITMLQADHARHPGTMVLLSGLEVSSLKTRPELNAHMTQNSFSTAIVPSTEPPDPFAPPLSVPSNQDTISSHPPSIPPTSALNPTSVGDNSPYLTKSPRSMQSPNPSTPRQVAEQGYVHPSPQARTTSSNPPSVKASGSPPVSMDSHDHGGRSLSTSLAPSPLNLATNTSPNRIAVSSSPNMAAAGGVGATMTTTVPSRPPFQQPAATSLSNVGSSSSNPIHIGSSSTDNVYRPPNTSSNGSMYPSSTTPSSLNTTGLSGARPPLTSLGGSVSSTLSNLLSSPPTTTTQTTGFPPSSYGTNVPSTSIAPPNAALPLSTAQQTFPTRTDPLSLSQPTAAPPAAQAAAEAVLQAAEQSSRLPPGAHPPTIGGGGSLGPSVMAGNRPPQSSLPSSMGVGAPRPSMTPSLPGSGGGGFQTSFSQTQPQGGMGAGGMGMNTGMGTRPTAPGGAMGGASTMTSTSFMNPSMGGGGMNQGMGAGGGASGYSSTGTSMMGGGVSAAPNQPGEQQLRPTMYNQAAGGGHLQPMQQPIQQPIKVWSGVLETLELLANNQRQPRQTPCSMFVSRPEISLEIKPQLWPAKLNMTLRPKSIFNAISAVIPINQNTVRTVHFQFGDNVQNVTMLKTLMISDPMQLQKKVVGIVQVSGQQPTMQQCPVKAFIMVWTEKSRQFTGLIHLDQEKFVQALRQALTQTARLQQMAMQQQQQQQQQQHQMSMGQGGGMQPGAMQGGGMQPGTMQGGGMQGGTMQGGGMQAGGMQGGMQGAGMQGGGMQGGGMQGGTMQGAGMQGGGMQPGTMQGVGMQGGGMQASGMQGGTMQGMQGGGVQQFQQQPQQQFNQSGMQQQQALPQQQAQFSSMQSQQGTMQQAAGNQGQGFLQMQPSQGGMGASSNPQNLGGGMTAQQIGQQRIGVGAMQQQAQRPGLMQQQQQYQYSQQQQQQVQQTMQQQPIHQQQQPGAGGMMPQFRRPGEQQMLINRIYQQQQQQQQPFMGSTFSQQPQQQQLQGQGMPGGMQMRAQQPPGPGGNYQY